MSFIVDIDIFTLIQDLKTVRSYRHRVVKNCKGIQLIVLNHDKESNTLEPLIKLFYQRFQFQLIA